MLSPQRDLTFTRYYKLLLEESKVWFQLLNVVLPKALGLIQGGESGKKSDDGYRVDV